MKVKITLVPLSKKELFSIGVNGIVFREGGIFRLHSIQPTRITYAELDNPQTIFTSNFFVGFYDIRAKVLPEIRLQLKIVDGNLVDYKPAVYLPDITEESWWLPVLPSQKARWAQKLPKKDSARFITDSVKSLIQSPVIKCGKNEQDGHLFAFLGGRKEL